MTQEQSDARTLIPRLSILKNKARDVPSRNKNETKQKASLSRNSWKYIISDWKTRPYTYYNGIKCKTRDSRKIKNKSIETRLSPPYSRGTWYKTLIKIKKILKKRARVSLKFVFHVLRSWLITRNPPRWTKKVSNNLLLDVCKYHFNFLMIKFTNKLAEYCRVNCRLIEDDWE